MTQHQAERPTAEDLRQRHLNKRCGQNGHDCLVCYGMNVADLQLAENPSEIPVTRLEVVDPRGRQLVHYGVLRTELQDDGRTLKCFLAKNVSPEFTNYAGDAPPGNDGVHKAHASVRTSSPAPVIGADEANGNALQVGDVPHSLDEPRPAPATHQPVDWTTRLYEALEAARLYVIRYPHDNAAAKVINLIDDARVSLINLQQPERETGWVEIEDFRGEPNSTPLAWWWWRLEPDSRPELDEILLDGEGKMCGKGGCGAQYYSHVKLAGFERPMPPDNWRRGSDD